MVSLKRYSFSEADYTTYSSGFVLETATIQFAVLSAFFTYFKRRCSSIRRRDILPNVGPRFRAVLLAYGCCMRSALLFLKYYTIGLLATRSSRPASRCSFSALPIGESIPMKAPSLGTYTFSCVRNLWLADTLYFYENEGHPPKSDIL